MSATIALLRVQFHFLFWPIVASGVCLLVYLLTPNYYWNECGVSFLNLMILGVAIWLSAPLLHGGEYMEGARDYMATRPYSQTRLFWMKISLLTLFTTACVVLATCTLVDAPRQVFLIYWGAALSLTYCCSAMTLLTRDLVRGILLGPVVWGVIMVIVYVSCGSITKLNYTLLPSNEMESFPIYFPSQFAFLPALMLTSPGLALWLACVIEQSRRYGKLTIPPLANLLPIPLAIAFLVMCVSCHNEGRALTYSSTRDPLKISQHGKWISGQRVFYVNYESDNLDHGTYSLNVLDTEDIQKGPQTLSQFGSEAVEEYYYTTSYGIYNQRTVPPYLCVLTNDRIMLTGYRNKVYVYSYDLPSGVTPLKTLEVDQPVKQISKTSEANRFHLLIGQPDGEVKRDHTVVPDAVKDLDLQSCDIKDVTLENVDEEFHPYQVKTGNRCYRFTPRTPTTEGRVDVFALEDSRIVGASVSFDFVRPEVEGPILAGFGGAKGNQIQIIDTTDLRTPPRITIDIPVRFRLQRSMVSIFGYENDNQSQPERPEGIENLFLTIGGGYLFLWEASENRLAVWDIHNLDRIRFIGLTPSQWDSLHSTRGENKPTVMDDSPLHLSVRMGRLA